ncbi:uncharacterized protein LACBIDRAFT_294986 [Laccaria bicolor S238N-H82]|uniref:Predicted protein n=1 Tax=Laccaria bicolor (strain S238N-H82 / ATCC MYA-4686) TaxID=486041 RepID=B0DJZ9_LACBS|nr:uncharacterized protein LACBIDRAFT_294986 [Laccaria bicolor S238N-H82]EDR05104.1 predicted protein [Laccaria bicolor S238N-H82]|eukprot:XP_001884494.1 predicted protein [Laccaria bicolor S238N-H82]
MWTMYKRKWELLVNPRSVLAEDFARNGFKVCLSFLFLPGQTIVPDYLNGDPVLTDATDPGERTLPPLPYPLRHLTPLSQKKTVDFQKWFVNHKPTPCTPSRQGHRGAQGGDNYPSATGYCLGAFENIINASVVSHPSPLRAPLIFLMTGGGGSGVCRGRAFRVGRRVKWRHCGESQPEAPSSRGAFSCSKHPENEGMSDAEGVIADVAEVKKVVWRQLLRQPQKAATRRCSAYYVQSSGGEYLRLEENNTSANCGCNLSLAHFIRRPSIHLSATNSGLACSLHDGLLRFPMPA